MDKSSNTPKWVWFPENQQRINQYVDFRREFMIDKVCDAELLISVDTNFVVWINGHLAGTGQFTDYPENKTFSQIDIGHLLQAGKNILAIQVHFCGENNFSYIPWQGGLWYSLNAGENIMSSDVQTFSRISPSYRQGLLPRITPQMGFTFEYKAVDDDWLSVEYSPDKSWVSSEVFGMDPVPKQRPLPMLDILPRVNSEIVGQGVFRRNTLNEQTVAEMMQTDFLSAKRATELFCNIKVRDDLDGCAVSVEPDSMGNVDGVYIIIDLVRQECGLIDLEMTAPAGVKVDIAVGEHLDDMRVRSFVGGRNFSSRYITCEGHQHFTHFMNRYSGRYMQLNISSISGPVTLHYAGLTPTEYALQKRGEFSCSNSLMNQIYNISMRTLHLCMHEHYEDCPWREQALYANDSRNQALTGYYTFGEYDFPKVSIELLRAGLQDDGYLEMCAPAKIDFTIPSFTFTWFLSLRDHLLHSGNLEFASKILPQARRIIDGYIATLENGLMPSPIGERFWHFYDWADGLTGDSVHPTKGGLTGKRFDAPMNMFLILALRATATIADACKNILLAERYNKIADEISFAADKKFWNEKSEAYQTFVGEQAIENHFAELTQSLALLSGIAGDRQVGLQRMLASENNGWVETTLSQSLYKFQALLMDDLQYAGWVFDKIKADWGSMLYDGATSFWETIKGQKDFEDAGSLCHGWSGTPAYFYQAYLLGIKPLDPGFRRFSVSPILNVVDQAEGRVPTPHGVIQVQWRKSGDKTEFNIIHPAGTEAVVPHKSPDDIWIITERC